MQSVRAADLLLGHDAWGANWIAAHRARLAAAQDGGAGGGGVVSGAAPQRAARQRPALREVESELQSSDGAERVRLRFLPDGAEVRVPSGTPVFDAASWNGIAIDSTCGGYGTCKKCKVRVVSGELPVGAIDPRAFTEEELDDGWRLACRAAARRTWSWRSRRCRPGRRLLSPVSAGM